MSSAPSSESRSDLQLVIFDCDGVLVDSEAIANRVLAEVLTECGLPTTPEQALAEYKGRILADVTARAEERNGGPLPDWIERFESRRADAFRAELKAIDGAREAVEAVKTCGIGVAVATQGKPSKTALTLGITGLRELFDEDAVFTSYEVPRGKPFPDLFLNVASSRAVDPARCAVIEDTTLGVEAAVAAGMKVFAYAAESDPAALTAAGADATFTSMTEVPALLGLT